MTLGGTETQDNCFQPIIMCPFHLTDRSSKDGSASSRFPSNQSATDHSRVIVHIDIDCFYAQVEMIRDPSLRDKPLGEKLEDNVFAAVFSLFCGVLYRHTEQTLCSYCVILGIQQKYLLVTCNYVARNLGVQKMGSILEAKKVCPQLVIRNGEDLTNYRQMSYKITGLMDSRGFVRH